MDRAHKLAGEAAWTRRRPFLKLLSSWAQWCSMQRRGPCLMVTRRARYSRKYLAQHEAELADYRAAKATMSDLLGGAKLPKMDALKKERRELSEKRKALLCGIPQGPGGNAAGPWRVKANIDHLLGHTDGREHKAQER